MGCITGYSLGTEMTRLFNIALRSTTLATRFLLIFFLAKYLEPSSIGYYGLFCATVGYSLYFVGLDFYTYASREIIKTPISMRGRLLKAQAALSGILYLVLLPFAIVFLNNTEWPSSLVWWFFPILFFEHLNQEMSRLLIVLSEQITASLVLFVRQGSWAIVIVIMMSWDRSSRHLETVMVFWACAGSAAAIMGVWKLKQLQMGHWCSPIDWRWIKKGLVISASFLLATLALRGIQTIDRYWLEALGGIEIVGAYVLLFGVANTLMTFLDAGVFAYIYPELIKHAHNQEYAVGRVKVRRMLFQTLAFSVAFGIVSWLALPYLLVWIGNPVYSNAVFLYPWLFMAVVINAHSTVVHFALYARGIDKPIIHSHLGAILAFVLSTWALSETYSILAVPIGLNVAFTVILVWKGIAYWQLNKAEKMPMPAVKHP
jgi:O-antigen/teichoic acid export membrane protein